MTHRRSGSAPSYRIRSAEPADAAIIAHHRVGMVRDMGILNEPDAPGLHAATIAYVQRALPRGEYVGWLIEADGQVVAGGGVVPRPLLPRAEAPDGGQEAYVLNVYVEPEHRRRRLARLLMEEILAWSRASGFSRISLHASDDGRRLYESMGFHATNEMRLEL
jgi:ribosomal protein S18 acetylase RimI-like enzyme